MANINKLIKIELRITRDDFLIINKSIDSRFDEYFILKDLGIN